MAWGQIIIAFLAGWLAMPWALAMFTGKKQQQAA